MATVPATNEPFRHTSDKRRTAAHIQGGLLRVDGMTSACRTTAQTAVVSYALWICMIQATTRPNRMLVTYLYNS